MRRHVRGFTLLEILLATALLAAGLALAFTTLRAATVAAERGETMAARSERMRAVEAFLRRRLASALPMAFETDTEGEPVRFIGEPGRVRFVADLPNYLGRGGPYLHDIGVDDGRLAVTFSMVLGGQTIEESEPRPPEPLLRDLRTARFRYRGLDDQNRLTDWFDEWDIPGQLPLQVLVELDARDTGAFPPLVVTLPQAEATGGGMGAGLGSRGGRNRGGRGAVQGLMPPSSQGDTNNSGGSGRQRLRSRSSSGEGR